MAQPPTVMMVQKKEEEHLMAEEHVHKAKKLWHEELDLEALMRQEEWKPRVLSRFCYMCPICSAWPIRMCLCLSRIVSPGPQPAQDSLLYKGK